MPPLHDYPNLYFPLNLPFTPPSNTQYTIIGIFVYAGIFSSVAMSKLWFFFMFYFFFRSQGFFSSLNILPSSASPLRKKTPLPWIFRDFPFFTPSFFFCLIFYLYFLPSFRTDTTSPFFHRRVSESLLSALKSLSFSVSPASFGVRTNKMAACCFYSSDTGEGWGTATLGVKGVGTRVCPENPFVFFRSGNTSAIICRGQSCSTNISEYI